MIVAGILHDIGKPVVAFQDEDDIEGGKGSYSFTGHEEKSYEIIRKWPFISEETKLLVRYHYLITGMAVDDRKFERTGDPKFSQSYTNRLKIWNSLDHKLQRELMVLKYCDDLGKGYPDLVKAVPEFLKDRYEKLCNYIEVSRDF